MNAAHIRFVMQRGLRTHLTRRRARGAVIGELVVIDRRAVLLGGDAVRIGDRSRLGTGVVLDPHGGTIEIGDDCSINAYAVLYGHGGLTIGNKVLIAAHSVIIPSEHIHRDKAVPIADQGNASVGITIGDNVWIGAHVAVLDGVTIGQGAIVAAGAVVRDDVAPYTVVAGVPASVKRTR